MQSLEKAFVIAKGVGRKLAFSSWQRRKFLESEK